MSLDSRVRDGLRRSADTGGLDADRVLDSVVSTHHRRTLRGRIVRGASAVAVAVTLFVGVAILISWRATPDRYRSVATVDFSPAGSLLPRSLTRQLPDPHLVALAPSTRAATLLAARLPAGDSRINFRVTPTGTSTLALAATAPSRALAQRVTEAWVAEVVKLRRAEARSLLVAQRRAVQHRVAELHTALQKIDAQLAKLDPARYGNVAQYDAPNSDLRSKPASTSPPLPLGDEGSVRELNLAFERDMLLNTIERTAQQAATERFPAPAPGPGPTQLLSQEPPTRVGQLPPATVPALAAGLAALVILLAGSVTLYRRRLHKGLAAMPPGH